MILRVFPRRTSYTPQDDLVAIGEPGLWNSRLKDISEVHISTLFTWDIPKARRLQRSWERFYSVVKLGGPAFGLDDDCFVAGKYVKPGITFTTRGCNRKCPWCLVPKMEGRFRELATFPEGNIVQDNNILLSSKQHFRRVCGMLKRQKRAVRFKGGLDARLLTWWHVEWLAELRIAEIFLGFDSKAQEVRVRAAAQKLRHKGLKRDNLRCYCLVGFDGDTPAKAEKRLRAAWDMGLLPFAQFYRPATQEWRKITPEWHDLVWLWSRPAATKAIMRQK